MAISVDRSDACYADANEAAEEAISEALRDVARWLYQALGREYDYLTSDEAIDEAISINEYLFTETGNRLVRL